MKSKRLPDTEFEIMEFIWDTKGPVTTSMVMEAIGQGRGWKIQTVVTLFSRLAERGFLRVEKGTGRERDFYPIISREEYLAYETQSFMSHYHKRSMVSLLNALHQTKGLTEDDLNELAQWLKDTKEKEE